jgi:RNA polymerase sigma-70 factor (ECF subfamily)
MTTQSLRQALVQHEAFVRELARVLTRSSAEADDVAQEVLLHTLERSPGAAEGLRAWLASSTRRIAWNLRRSERRRKARERHAARPESLTDPTTALAARQLLVDAVLALDEPFRRTIILVHDQGLTAGEIAAREGVPPSTVRTRLHRAHGLLRRQLEARGLDRSALSAVAAVGGRSVARVHAIPGLSGAAALGTVAVLGAIVWANRVPIEPERSSSVDAAALLQAPDGPTNSATVALVRAEALTNVHMPPERVPAIVEHPYWGAVRSARKGIARYETGADSSEALRHIFVEAEDSPFPIGESVSLDLSEGTAIVNALRRALASQPGLALRVSDAALLSANKQKVALQRTTPGAATSLYELLQLVVAPAGPGIGWDIVGDTLWIASWEELAVFGTPFELAVDDLLITPSEYGLPVPYPTFDQPSSIEELQGLLEWHLTAFDQIDIASSERGFVVVHTPRVLRESQAWMDHFRSFRAPLPEEGQPGRTQQMPRSAGDERVLRALRSEGGPARIVPARGESLTQRWRRFGERHDVAVLWTLGASDLDRERSATSEGGAPSAEREWPLRFEVVGGALLVRAADEVWSPGLFSAQSLSSAFFDLRRVLTGAEATSEQMASHPAMARMMKDGQMLLLRSAHLEELLRKYLAPGSWDEDPRTHLLMSRCSTLLVHHSPWVLDDIDSLIEALR